MCGLDARTYWEVIIHPSHFVEQFADFIIQKTSCAIEYLEVSTELNPFAIIYDDCSWRSVGFAIENAKVGIQKTQIVSRIDTHKIDIDAFIESLKDFAHLLTTRMQEQVGFCFHIEEKSNHDWMAMYKESVEPLECAGFYIRPSWKESVETYRKLDREIIIDPALAFGSGHHASTFMCLEILSTIDLKDKTLLDVGCGSGILGIAAKKFGADVYACDTDELAVQESYKNALLNNVYFNAIWQGSVTQSPLHTPRQYNVIVANIVAFVLKLLHDDFKVKCAKGGFLILSGILDKYKFDIMETFSDFNVLEVHSREEWIAIKLTL